MNPDSAMVFDIQRFSLHDGPGVRTTVFFKGCPLRCRWCQNPESLSPAPEMAFYSHRCVRCFTCEAACAENAITRGTETRIDCARCTSCGACAGACEHGALRVIGSAWSADALFREIIRDRDFFQDSGGGVTFSGGEPLLYPEFIASLAPMLAREGIHTVVETCGHVRPGTFGRLRGTPDSIYFDIKHADDTAHRLLTGQGNALILENFFSLAGDACDLQPRMPVIPGFNDDPENIQRTAGLVRSAGLNRIHCLPYNNLGRDKLARIHSRQQPLDIHPPSPEGMDMVRELFADEGIEAVIYT